MPFEIVRNDITHMQVDAIVNSANPRPMVGLGTDSRIHEQAGPLLLEAREKIGNIRPGCVAITEGYDLPAKYVIHTVGPVWRGGLFGEGKVLRRCYENALQLALEYGCGSIAFPLISTNNYGFPKDKALQIAMDVFSSFLMEHEMHIYLVVFSGSAYRLSEKLFRNIASYIDDHYVEEVEKATYGSDPDARKRQIRNRMEWGLREEAAIYGQEGPTDEGPGTAMIDAAMMPQSACPSGAVQEKRTKAEKKAASSSPAVCSAMPIARQIPSPDTKVLSLEELLRKTDAGFTETLLDLIDQRGKKDSEVYKKALLSKQHFSKIRNNPDYKPTKATAISLALALELNLEETRDLIGRAGYALTGSSKFDLIIRYFIEKKNYNIVEINMALYEFDQNLLGS